MIYVVGFQFFRILVFLLFKNLVTRLLKSWLQKSCPHVLCRFGWMITLFAFLYLYSQILFNKIAIISYQKKKKLHYYIMWGITGAMLPKINIYIY